jgi:hypothetical protein
MRDRQHQRWRDQASGAEIAARADDGDDGAADGIGGRLRTTDNGVSGGGEEQRCNCRREEFHPLSLNRCG